MWLFKRQHTIALVALGVALLICTAVPVLAFLDRQDAAQNLSDQQDALQRLMAASQSNRGPAASRKDATAPVNAFFDAQTTGLAGADFQAYVESLANQRAALVSIAVQPTSRDDPPDTIRIEASLDIDLDSLQGLLYQLESGVPYVFVESMSVRSSTQGTSASAANSLRVTLGLRSFWRLKRDATASR